MIEAYLPEDNPEVDFLKFLAAFNLVLTPVAFAASYYRNGSVKWALVHTLFAAPYVVFVAYDAVKSD